MTACDCAEPCVVSRPRNRACPTPSSTQCHRDSSMERNGSDVLVDCLVAWGVDTIFGLPGDGINGVMEAIRRRDGAARFVQVRHEESAALAACAHSKWTG